jgi:hypothetical protein
MLPALGEDDYVWIARRGESLPAIGSIVVSLDPSNQDRILVKRVLSHGTHTVALGSDNPQEGRDSRHFGSVPAELVIGTVTRVWRAD